MINLVVAAYCFALAAIPSVSKSSMAVDVILLVLGGIEIGVWLVK